MTLTPEQTQQLNAALKLIETELHNMRPELPSSDSFSANQVISNTRMKLQNLDHKLYHCLKLLDSFHTTIAEYSPRSPRFMRHFTVDDL